MKLEDINKRLEEEAAADSTATGDIEVHSSGVKSNLKKRHPLKRGKVIQLGFLRNRKK